MRMRAIAKAVWKAEKKSRYSWDNGMKLVIVVESSFTSDSNLYHFWNEKSKDCGDMSSYLKSVISAVSYVLCRIRISNRFSLRKKTFHWNSAKFYRSVQFRHRRFLSPRNMQKSDWTTIVFSQNNNVTANFLVYWVILVYWTFLSWVPER